MEEEPNKQNSSQQSASLIKGSTPEESVQSHQPRQVVVSFQQGQLQENQQDELGQINLRPAPSVEVRRSVDVSAELPQIRIMANKSALEPRANNSNRQQKIKGKRPYSEPRSEKGDDNFSDRDLSETKSQERNRNILISVVIGGLAAIGGFYISKEDKRWAGAAGLFGFLGTYFLLHR